jgi:hypothetical protein
MSLNTLAWTSAVGPENFGGMRKSRAASTSVRPLAKVCKTLASYLAGIFHQIICICSASGGGELELLEQPYAADSAAGEKVMSDVWPGILGLTIEALLFAPLPAPHLCLVSKHAG